MANEFKPTVGGKVSKAEAQKWIEKYDNDHRKNKDKDTKSVFFGKEFLTKILSTPDCAGISFFFAKNFNNFSQKEDVALVLVPTTEDGRLLWPEIAEGKGDGEAGAYDSGTRCPPYCPK